MLYAACFPILTSSETENLKEDLLSLEKEVKELLKKDLKYRGRSNHIFMLVFRETTSKVGGWWQPRGGRRDVWMRWRDRNTWEAQNVGLRFSTQRIWSWDNNLESHAWPKQCKGQERNQWFRGNLCYLVSNTIHQEFYLSLGSSCISLSD